MSGNSYQKYEVQRLKIASKPKSAGRKNRSGVVRIAVPEHLEQKIEHFAGTFRLPKEVLASEAIRQGMAVLRGDLKFL